VTQMTQSWEGASPHEFRSAVRAGKWAAPTAGVCMGYAQANLAILPSKQAMDFLVFANRNPKPCPIIEVLDTGCPEPIYSAPCADIRTDLPKYRVYRRGQLEEERSDIIDLWQDDFVSFLIGCSFSFEKALLDAGVPVRHIELGRNVPMYITNIQCRPAGVFHGPMVVSMRPIPGGAVARAVEVTAAMHAVHGAPVHIGSPEDIGISHIDHPDFGDSVPIADGEVPVFWACGVTPQAAALTAKPEIMITHSPGHMFITDVRDHDLLDFMSGLGGAAK
jgi:uncharacterized protein YcsI (UPF0317 family)